MISCRSSVNDTKREVLESYFQRASIPFAIMGQVEKNGAKKVYAFGSPRHNAKNTVTENHIFRIFSMTKPIITVAALQLVEDDMITLDEPLNEILPEMTQVPVLRENGELYYTDASITLRQLLTHTSGFGYDFIYKNLSSYKVKSDDNVTFPRLFEPGQEWAYGTSLDWVVKVIEKLTNKSLEEYVYNNITQPLEMKHTFFKLPDSLVSNLVTWGLRDINGNINELPLINKKMTPNEQGKTLYSTLNDYLRFVECILNNGQFKNNRILKEETVDMMFRPNISLNMKLNYDTRELQLPMESFLDPEDTWGLGWALEANKDEPVRPQNAAYWTGSANTYFTIDKASGVGVVYFSQILPFNDKESFKLYKRFEQSIFN